MSQTSVATRAAPNGLMLAVSSVTLTAVSLVAWLLIALGTVFNPNLSTQWIYLGLALPGATLGSLASHATGRRAYFLIGLAITLIPLVAYVLLAATTPPPPAWSAD
jgi:hypothetical protein